MQGLDFFGGRPLREEDARRAAEWERENGDARIVILADLWLDRPDTLLKLQRVLNGEQGPGPGFNMPRSGTAEGQLLQPRLCCRVFRHCYVQEHCWPATSVPPSVSHARLQRQHMDKHSGDAAWILAAQGLRHWTPSRACLC